MHRKQHFNIIRGMSLCHHYAPEDYVHDQDMFKTMIQFPNHERRERELHEQVKKISARWHLV